MSNEFYSLKPIRKEKADYYMIFGERSNGKTWSVKELGIHKYVETGGQLAIIRRWDEDFKGKRGQTMFSDIVETGLISKLTKGEWTDIYYYSSRWYFCKYDEKKKRIVSEDVFAYGFSLNSGEHDKSTSYPRITTILFDEFITRTIYLPDEFILFTNTLSTIIRERDNVEIFMLGNTVNKFCPYFKEMGIKNVQKMEQGTIDVYTYGESELRVAVEYCGNLKKSKKSNKYFAFDNPKLNMIKHGAWELAIYPHLPMKYKPNDIIFTYFIIFEDNTLQCEIVQPVEQENVSFTYIHRKTTKIKNSDDLVFSLDYHPSIFHRRNIAKPRDNIGKKVFQFFKDDNVYYQDNEIGELIRNYLMVCNQMSMIKN